MCDMKKCLYLYQLEMEAKYNEGEWCSKRFKVITGWLWRLRSTHNAQIVATQHETYKSRAHCMKMICQIYAGAVNVSPWVKVYKDGKLWRVFDGRWRKPKLWTPAVAKNIAGVAVW